MVMDNCRGLKYNIGLGIANNMFRILGFYNNIYLRNLFITSALALAPPPPFSVCLLTVMLRLIPTAPLSHLYFKIYSAKNIK
jgi:hypothetical protein